MLQRLAMLLLLTCPLGALASEPLVIRGKPAGSGGLFARGQITLNERGIVCDIRRVFREDSVGYTYADMDSFNSSIGLFRGYVMLNLVDGSVVTLSTPPSDARTLKTVLSERVLKGGSSKP